MLILHIGTPKTGSSALQHYLMSNADALLEMGVRYISAGREGTHRSSHRDLVLALLGKADLSVWQQVRAELAEHEGVTSVISAEGLWFEDPAKVRTQLPAGELDVQIVVYLRRQDHYLQSLWKQAVLDGRRHNFDLWRERVPLRGNYLATLDKWACEFGADALLVRPYDRNGKRDTIGDFCGVLGLECAPAAKEIVSKNPTPRLEIVQFFRALNQLNLDVGRHQLRQSLVGKSAAYVRSCDVLSYEKAAQVIQSYESENAELVQKYYRDKSTPLFPPLEPYPAPELWHSQSDEYFQLMTDMLRVVTDSMARGQIRPAATPGKRKKTMRKVAIQKE